MNSETPRPLTTALAQSATARTGVSGNRIRASSLARVAESLREHGLPAELQPSGRLVLVAATSRLTAQSLPGGAIEVRAFREGRHSILGLLDQPDEVAHLLIRCAGMAAAWELTGEIHDRLVLAGERSVLSEIPMGDGVFVRLGERTYAEFIGEHANACFGEPASVALETHICAHSLDDLWRFRTLRAQDFPTVGRITGGQHETAESALAALALHRARTPEWERLH
ncbi:hypothetical protein [Tsukamurella sp. PLM1]|uniref:hypothetical protein n=1 Tax=Tsukamurella sp. PLM1 TaxID=2929795 RepID=UPI0020672675|nr:hypothetical protein [Tsukamurella sp. PLM1]BDH57283.1 hypothetical protein MTP03_22220 [Tsukamurella sp. PLM1]